MRIESLNPTGNADRFLLRFEDGSRLKVPAPVIGDLGLHAGMELDEGGLEQLRQACSRASARLRAVRIVSCADVTRSELDRRLRQKGETAEDAAAAAEWLEKLGAVNDEKTALHLADLCSRKGYGPRRLKQELYAKGVPKEYWQEALDRLTVPDEALDSFLRQRFGGSEPDEKELHRAADALLRRGHGYETVRRALLRYQQSLAEQEDE